MNETLVVVMAKGASKRVPRKNLAMVGGRRLIDFTFDHVAGIGRAVDVTVMTECPEVAACCGERHISWERPGGQGGFYTRIDLAVRRLEQDREFPYRHVVLLGADTPIRPRSLTDDAVDLLEATQCDIVISVVPVPVHWHSYRTYTIRTPGDLLHVDPTVDQELPSQLYPRHYVLTGGIYALTRKHLAASVGRGALWPGVHARPLVTELADFVEIDVPEDLEAFRRRVEHGHAAGLSRSLSGADCYAGGGGGHEFGLS